MNKLNSIFKSEFVRNISVQVFGTGLAQLIPLLVMPILSRIYLEEDFAMYTSFMAVVGVASVALGGRYQHAIVLPKNDKDAFTLFGVSILLTIGYSILFLLLCVIGDALFSEYFKSIYYYVPIYLLVFGLWQSTVSLSIRFKQFKINSFGKIIQAISNSSFSLFFGWVHISIGLIFGKFIGVLLSSMFLLKKTNIKLINWNKQSLLVMAKKYKKFPIYGILPSFFDAASVQAPVFIIGKYFSTQVLGFYGLTVMALAGPLSIVAVSFKDVFYQKIAEKYNEGDFVKIKKIFLSSAFSLLLLGLPMIFVLLLYGEDLFKLVFGNNWGESGKYASVLIIGFVVKLVVSPLSIVFNVYDKLNVLSYWQTMYFITTFITLFSTVLIFKVEIYDFLIIYLIHEIILYVIYFILQYILINKNLSKCVE